MNALLDATRSRLIETGLPFLRQLRASPTVAELLERAGETADPTSVGSPDVRRKPVAKASAR